MVNLDRYVKSCNTLNHLSHNYAEDKTNKTEDLNLSMFKIIAGINESKTLTKRISCESKCKFYGRKCNSNQWCNNDKCWSESIKCQVCEKGYI